jgi:2-dehydro-3-deoxy-D-arabinonate dehydratase
MSLCRYAAADGVSRWGWLHDDKAAPLDEQQVLEVLSSSDPAGLNALATEATHLPLHTITLLAPVGAMQEVWAAGVTYESSKFARMAESTDGGDFYAKVYVAERPELFLKATMGRVVGPNAQVRIRADSKWNVPEPELTALISANGTVLGYTIGNDMSSRDIEGENPLYLPQAKVYRGSCAMGPVVVPAGGLDAQNLTISLHITRNGQTAWTGETSTARMRRRVEELAEWLFRENDFPYGVFLMTGTGLIPSEEFSLQAGDEIFIAIERIGALRNTVAGG